MLRIVAFRSVKQSIALQHRIVDYYSSWGVMMINRMTLRKSSSWPIKTSIRTPSSSSSYLINLSTSSTLLSLGAYFVAVVNHNTSTATFCEGTNEKAKQENNPNTNSSDNNHILPDNIINQLDVMAQTVGKSIQEAINTGIPTEISYGFVCGYSSGYALKKVGKMVSIAFGLSFALLQSLAYAGYIQLNHEALKRDIMDKYLDLNHDGKVDEQDLKLLYNKALQILTFNIPGGAGFATGFIGGLRAG